MCSPYSSEDQSSQLPSSALLQRLWELREKLMPVESLSDLPESWLEKEFVERGKKKRLGYGVQGAGGHQGKGRGCDTLDKVEESREERKADCGNAPTDILRETSGKTGKNLNWIGHAVLAETGLCGA